MRKLTDLVSFPTCRLFPALLFCASLPNLAANDPSDFFTQTGTDPSFQELVDNGIVVPGERFHPGPVLGSTINVNLSLLEQQTGPLDPIAQDIRIHTQNHGSIQRSSFHRWTRWYQEDGNVQIMRLFEGEQNVRDGIGPDGSPGRIEAFFPYFAVEPGTWAVWEATYTIIKPLSSTIFQLFHDGGQLWAFHLRMTPSGTINFNRRRDIPWHPTNITIAENMVGRSIGIRVRANGYNYEVFRKIPGEDPDWVLMTTGFYPEAVNNRISFRWGMYRGSQPGQSIPNDGLLLVSGANRFVDEPVSRYYWDSNGANPGFGNAQGIWADPTAGGATQGWSPSSAGTVLPGEVSTAPTHALFFGTDANGLGTGTIAVSGTVSAGDITFGAASGDITLSGGEIVMSGDRLIDLPGPVSTHTITSILSGTGSRTIGGDGILNLTGANSLRGPLIIGNNTGIVRLQINGISHANGTPSAAGAPNNAADGIIQIGAGSQRSIMELVGSTSAQSTNRSVRLGSNSGGIGSGSIWNNNDDPAHTLTFTNPAFNVAATNTGTSNRTLNLAGSNTGYNMIQGAIIDNVGTTGGRVALSKFGTGTWVLSGANTYSGNTTVNNGTLALFGAGMASPITVSNNASLGFAIGAPAASTSSVNLGSGTVRIFGAVDNASNHVLITADGGITGTPTLHEPIPGYELKIRDDGIRLVLVHVGVPHPFTDWSNGAAPDADSSGDGIPNAIAWVLGATGPLDTATALLPRLDLDGDPDYLVFSFNRGNEAAADPVTAIEVEFSTNLMDWTTASHDGENVIVEVTEGDPGSTVAVKLKRSTRAPAGNLFVRLQVAIANP